nr:hypothetical protein [Tanacetum cinerariifolium]
MPYEESTWSRTPVRDHAHHPGVQEQRYPHDSLMSHAQMDSPTLHSRATHHSESPRALGGKEGVVMAVRQGQCR